MQHLARVGARGEQRVVAALLGVAEARALLVVAVHLADEAVDIDDEAPGAGAGARPPGARQRLGEQPVELAHVAEGERAQERAQRRGCRQPAAQQPAGAARPQKLTVIDRVGAQEHRVDQRHHLAARVRRPRPVARQAHEPPHKPLDPQPSGERRHQRNPGVRDDPLVVEADLDAVESDQPVIVHHQGDLLGSGRDCPLQSLFACSGGHSLVESGQNSATSAVDRGSDTYAKPTHRGGIPPHERAAPLAIARRSNSPSTR